MRMLPGIPVVFAEYIANGPNTNIGSNWGNTQKRTQHLNPHCPLDPSFGGQKSLTPENFFEKF